MVKFVALQLDNMGSNPGCAACGQHGSGKSTFLNFDYSLVWHRSQGRVVFSAIYDRDP